MALCPGNDTTVGAMDQAMMALWAMRVLDNWALKHGHRAPSPILWDAGDAQRNPMYRIVIPGYELSSDMGFITRPFQGRTPDDARFVAAIALSIEDSTINPIPGIEWL